uniref:Ig-like domain-containing protein n=1 Tax=Catharus ustulatus TaxID=91951 RepID=A0A8C3UJ60_CATUS
MAFSEKKIIALFPSAVAVARAQVQQEPSLETTEGTGVNISCSHSNIGTGDTIAWYRQLPEKGPVFLGRVHKGLRELPDIAGQLWVSADRRSRWNSLLYIFVSSIGFRKHARMCIDHFSEIAESGREDKNTFGQDVHFKSSKGSVSPLSTLN